MGDKILLAGGCVLTLGSRLPNLAEADVLIEGGRIAAVGTDLRARDAERVDASDSIVMPGFVDVHRHAWRSLFRNLGHVEETTDHSSGARRFNADDVYAATSVGLLGALEAGITSVVDCTDPEWGPELIQAALQAHADAGIRSVVALPPSATDPGGAPSELTTIAAAVATPSAAGIDAAASEWGPARDRGLRIHAHVGWSSGDRGVVAELARRDLLGPDLTLVHCTNLDDGDLAAISSSGTAVAVTPSSEMAGGAGPPPVQRFLDNGIRPGLGVDDERLSPGDAFAQMRAVISLQHATMFDRKLAGKGSLPPLLTTRDVIRYATVDGARVAGLGGVVGTLEPGMAADVVVLRADRPNIAPVNDPIGAVVWGMDTSNIDWVIVGGQARVRGGELDADMVQVRALAEEARARVGVPLGAGA